MIWENRAVSRVHVHLVGIASLVCALIAFAALPTFASAAGIEVDSLGDAPQKEPSATCDTGALPGENCTLRAAIQAANFSPGFSLIEFPSAIFEGGQEIEPATALPAITQPLTMFGHPVPYEGNAYSGPSVGVRAPSGAAGLTVKASNVTIEQVAFGGGKAGIEVLNESTGFVAKGNWFGLRVIGTAATTQKGVVLGPGSDGATIGEAGSSGRNVFTNAGYGIYVEGASQAKILGNYIGVEPKGKAAAGLTRGVRIVDTSISSAEENEIGGIRTSAPGATDCGGACNVIVASIAGVDLHGEVGANLGSAKGPTTISGNYVGLAPNGTALPLLNGSIGILATRPSNGSEAVGAGDVTVGGPTAAEANVIDNGQDGMVAEGAEGLVVEHNLFGWLPASASAGSGPAGVGLGLVDDGVGDLPEVSGNEMHLDHGVFGVEVFGPGAKIVGNKISGGTTGLLVGEHDTGKGSLISENLLEDQDLYGVLIEDDANTVAGNTILRAGRNGIITDREAPNPWPTANRIGGDSPALENLIEGSDKSAISVGGEPSTRNEVLGNYGLGNGGPFILLREQQTGHPTNGEIKPPVLEVVLQSSASGTAKPGAKVRLFTKPSADPGSLGRMIGSAIADASGHWSATLATRQAVGALVAATQTTAAGTPVGATSEVSPPTAAAADPTPPEEPQGGGGSNNGTSSTTTSPPTTTPAPVPIAAPATPKVTITKAPKKSSDAATAKFRFKAEPAAGASLECSLDSAKWTKCRSPKIYRKLEPGRHTFRVRAKAAGRTGPVTKYQFTVKP